MFATAFALFALGLAMSASAIWNGSLPLLERSMNQALVVGVWGILVWCFGLAHDLQAPTAIVGLVVSSRLMVGVAVADEIDARRLIGCINASLTLGCGMILAATP